MIDWRLKVAKPRPEHPEHPEHPQPDIHSQIVDIQSLVYFVLVFNFSVYVQV